MPQSFSYGGQAVIEGVLIVGQRSASLAVRKPDGRIWTGPLALNPLVRGRLRQIPFVRGIVVLLATLVLGITALNRSAGIAMADPDDESQTDDVEPPALGAVERGAIIGSLLFALVLGITVFFLLPLLGARSLDAVIPSSLVSNLLEGLIRLGLLVGYIWIIGRLGDIKRVFAYHGAEHMTIHAYEHQVPLQPSSIRQFPKAHPRCGTAFLITVVVVSIVVFAMVGRPSLWLAAVSRVTLVPVIAAISYEMIRYAGAHAGNPLAQLLAAPGILFQRMTTRQPDDAQIEVAVAAMSLALSLDAAPTLGEGDDGAPTDPPTPDASPPPAEPPPNGEPG